MTKLEHLELDKSYEFNVIVFDVDHNFAGKLSLSPSKITLRIMGENHGEREFHSWVKTLDTLRCTGFGNAFVLAGLNRIEYSSRRIPSNDENIGFFEILYDVGFLVYSNAETNLDSKIRSFSITSKDIDSWIGYTINQSKIFDSYENGQDLLKGNDKFNELFLVLDDIGYIQVNYNLTIYSSNDEFGSGIRFPPSFSLIIKDGVLIENSDLVYRDLYSILSFLMGRDLSVKKVMLELDSCSSCKTCLYYPSKKGNPNRLARLLLFPLGKDLIHDMVGLPPLPLDVFNTYFSLESNQRGYFYKYLNYKRMENKEERFLGYFRILESLSHKKKTFLDPALLESILIRSKPYLVKRFKDPKNVRGFVSAVNRANKSKYNTAKCIQDFYNDIPESITNKWVFGKEDIKNICDLRNDITHANDYYITDGDLEAKTSFVEALLILSLMKLLDIDISILNDVIERFYGYSLIRRH